MLYKLLVFLQCFPLHSVYIGDNFKRGSKFHVHSDDHVFLTEKHQCLAVNLLRHEWICVLRTAIKGPAHNEQCSIYKEFNESWMMLQNLLRNMNKVKKSSLKETPQEAVEPSIISIPECSRYPLTRNWPSRNSLYEGSDLLNIPLGSFNVFIQPQGFHITSCPVKVKRVNSVWGNKSFFMLSTVFSYWRRIYQQNLNRFSQAI